MTLAVFVPLLVLSATLTPITFSQEANPTDETASTNTTWTVDRAFGTNVFKVGSHLHAVDEGTVSHRYYRYNGGFVENGFDALLFTATAGDLHPHTLRNPSFEQPIGTDWTVGNSGSTVPGSYLIERTTSSALDGAYSLRLRASVPGSGFGYSMAELALYRFPISAPLASKIILSFGVYPVMMTDVTAAPDSLFVMELSLSHWDSKTVQPSVFLVLQDDPTESLAGSPFQDSANAFAVSMNKDHPLSPQAWNMFTYNITDLIASRFSLSQAMDSAVLNIRVQAYSRNEGVSEFYFDKLSWATPWSTGVKSRNDPEVYPIVQDIVRGYSTSTMLMVPGLHVATPYSHFAWFNADQYRITTQGPTGSQTDIDYVHSQGDYIFLNHPAGRNTYLTNATARLYTVDGVTAFSGFGGWNNLPVWDYYLSRARDYAPIGYAEFDVHVPSTIDHFACCGPATYVYAEQKTPSEIIEAIAQGRLFMEYQTVSPVMRVYFTAEYDTVPMGRFPVYVSQGHTAQLHLQLSQTPALDDLVLYMVRNGTVIETVPIPGGTSFDRTFTYPLPDQSNYFRYELRRIRENQILALSNPILYMKRDLPAGTWIAATPSLAYGSAFTRITNIQNQATSLKFNVEALPNLEVAVRVHTPRAPATVQNAAAWNYDANAQILTVTARGSAEVTIVFEDFTINADPSSISITQGLVGTSTITLTSLGGFVGTVELTVTVSPDSGNGPTATLFPTSVRLESGETDTSNVVIATLVITQPGRYTVTVTGTSGEHIHSTTVTLTVVAVTGLIG